MVVYFEIFSFVGAHKVLKSILRVVKNSAMCNTKLANLIIILLFCSGKARLCDRIR